MHPRSWKLLTAALWLVTDLSPAWAQRAPSDQPTATIVRKVGDPLQTSRTLTKNLYRTESYEESYTVQVPYEVDETYYETVPYEVDEPYQDLEYYDDTEYQCRTISVPRRECRTERVCDRDHLTWSPATRLLAMLVSPAYADRDGRVGDRDGRNGNRDGRDGRDGRRPEPPRPPPSPRPEPPRPRPEPPRPRPEPPRPRPPEPRPEPPRPRPPEPRPEPPRPRPPEPRPEPPRPRPPEPRPEPPRPRPPEPRPEPPRPPNPRPEPPPPRPEPPHPRPPEPRPPEPRPPGPRPPEPRPPEPRPPRPPEPRPPRCHDEERCRTWTDNQRVCDWVPVRKSRWVTRYRRVTRYRQEERVRRVTRYREETRCCVTKTREVFDHQWAAQVNVRFPETAVLIGNEVEKFGLTLNGDEQTPVLDVQVLESVFGYQPLVTTVNANQFEVEMKQLPKYSAVELGLGSLEGLTLTENPTNASLTFLDKGARHRVASWYNLQVLDVATGTELARLTWTGDGEKSLQQSALGVPLKAGQLVRLLLQVQRESALLDRPVDFQQDVQLLVAEDAKYDPAPYMDPNQTGKFVINDSREKTEIWFRDLTKDIPQVKTRYEFSLTDASNQPLANGVFERAQVRLDDGRLKLRLKEDFGMGTETLAKLKPGFTVIINYKAVRQGSRFNPNPFVISKKVTLEIEE